MNHSLCRLAGALALASAALAPIAHASTVLDFNDPSLIGIYEQGQYFDQSGFRMTQEFDSGIVDTGAALGEVAPTNDDSQFYTNLNDGYVELTRVDGGTFSLDGFSAVYVPTDGASDVNTMVLIIDAILADGSYSSFAFSLGDTSSNTQGYPFYAYNDPSFFSEMTGLVAVDFFTCTLSSDGDLCDTAISNTAGFALDDIMVTPLVAAVPEPSTTALMALGVLSLVLVRRRNNRSPVQGAV